jgi:hypothetical protein
MTQQPIVSTGMLYRSIMDCVRQHYYLDITDEMMRDIIYQQHGDMIINKYNDVDGNMQPVVYNMQRYAHERGVRMETIRRLGTFFKFVFALLDEDSSSESSEECICDEP